jgi:hypothetical protein
MQTKTVKNLAVVFAVAAGAGAAIMCGAEGMAMARVFMHKSSDAFQAAASLGLGFAGLNLFPALGASIWWDVKAKAERQAPKQN